MGEEGWRIQKDLKQVNIIYEGLPIVIQVFLSDTTTTNGNMIAAQNQCLIYHLQLGVVTENG